MKSIFWGLLFFFFHIGFSQSPSEIKFVWKSAHSSTKTFEKASMLIPVKFQKDTTTYFLQFDTGALHSFLYKNRLNSLQPSSGELQTSIGKIIFRENESIEASTDEIYSVGTVGADFLKDKIVHIDFQNQVININPAYNLSEYEVQQLELLSGRPVIKFRIGGKVEKLLFDTGSSLFGVWTTKRNWNKWRDKTDTPKTFPIASWGKISTGNYSDFNHSIFDSLEDRKRFENIQIWFIKDKKFRKFFQNNGLSGLLGNQLFLNNEIILDYKNNLFGIK